MISLEAIVYFLCFASSGLCAYLLVSAFRKQREKLLLWSCICFCLLALNSLLVFIDIIMLPNISLAVPRALTSFAAVSVLLYGFVWESQ